MSFRPRTYNARVNLFRTAGHPLWCSFDEDYGWGRLASKGVELVMVPGAHEMILEEPWVGVLGQELSKALRRANDQYSRNTLKCEPEQSSSAAPEIREKTFGPAAVSIVTGQPAQLRPVSSEYEKLIAASEKSSESSDKTGLEFWQKQLADAPELLDLPADRPRPAQGDYAGGCFSFTVSPELAEAVVRLAEQEHDQTWGILLSVFFTLLHRYTASQDIVIGVPLSIRSNTNADVVANLENTLALRGRISGDPTFRELIRRLAGMRMESLAHARLPFAEVLKAVRPQISRSYTPLFQVMFAFEEQPLPEASSAGIRFAPFQLETPSSKFDLSLNLVKEGQGITAKLHFSTAIFDQDRISRMAEHFVQLLRSVAHDPDRPVSKLNILPDHERNRLLNEWTATESEYPKDKTLVDLISERVRQNPSAEALICGKARFTYAELSQYATQFANRLRQSGVGRGALVGICLDRSAEMVVGILGTLFAGAAYVPLDPKYPADRLRFTLEDAKVKALVTQSQHRGLFPTLNCPALCLDSLECLAKQSKQLIESCFAAPTDLAYVIYTSGSTGKPKGVALEHRNTVALVSWAAQAYSSDELSGVLASTSICFDLSVFELFVPLCCGGRVILAENALGLRGLEAASEVRLVNTVPSAIRELLRLKAVPAGVQVINLAGEPLSSDLVDQIYQETSVRKVFDLYGPTETTTYSTGVLRQQGQRATIGRPLSNEQVYLLDEHFQPVPIGMPGEIFIGGAGVARGYLGGPELTAQKFVAHPFKKNGVLYRTGDLGRWRADGNLEYLGRLDHQVKIRGYRIELGEIETVLKNQAGVAAAVVVAREDHPGDKRLVAYVERRGGASLKIEDLKRGLGEQLPEFMTPSDFVFLDVMPMTPNGKVDRKALPVPESQGSNSARTDLIAPRTSVEARLQALWRDVLHLTQIGMTDNFFALGGHSLTAARVISGIRDVFGIELPLSAIFSKPTIEQLAESLSSASAAEKQAAAIIPIPRSGDLPVSYVQERLWFLDQLMPRTAAYNVPAALRLKGPLDDTLLLHAVNQVCARHEALRASFCYKNGALAQVIKTRLKLDLPCIDLQEHVGGERELKLQELVNQYARRPFDLAAGPLIRLTLFRLEPKEHVLLVVMHHTISDGWSLALFFQELASLYDAAIAKRHVVNLPTLPIQYSDFAHWQRDGMSGAVLEHELAYWKKALEGAPAETALPLDHPRPSQPTGRAHREVALLGAASIKKMTDFAQREGCTPFMFFLAGLLVTLRKWTGQEDLVVGTVVAGRTRSEVEHLLGCFMNFLPLRARVRDGQHALDLLANVRSVVLEGQTHQACPFEKIVAAAHPQRRHDQNPLYNVALLLQNFPSNLFQSETIQCTSFPVALEEALLDLRFEIEQAGDDLALVCEYRTELFDQQTIKHLLDSWAGIIETLAGSPQKPIAECELSPELCARRKVEGIDSGRPKIIISATFTAEPISESIQHWLSKLSFSADLEFAPFNQVFQQLLDPASVMAETRQGLNVILARLEDWSGGSNNGKGQAVDPAENIERCAQEFLAAVKAAAERDSAPLLICLCPPRPSATADSSYSEHLLIVQRGLEAELSSLPNVYVLSAEELGRWYPVADYYDLASEEMGHVPYTSLFFTALGTGVVRKFHALDRPSYKVIALDCDNTLWAGVCGEDGPQGIQLGGPHQALQQFMRTQRESGVLLCLCSKNNEQDVHAVFAERADFPLQSRHFTACRLNWELKSANLKSLAAELGLGLDSFIFIDDNPLECAEVEANCPGVLVLQLPENPELIPQFLNHCWAFDRLRLTSEDRQRADLYEQNQARERLRVEAPTLEDFLANLQLKVEIQPVEKADWQRVAQLTQRTNQFNFVTRRMTERDLAEWLNSGCALVVRVSDRFGEYGLVGAVIYCFESDSLAVDNMLLSCRVLGRGVEHRILARVGELARGRGARWVDIHFVPTARNQPASNFLESVGLDFKQPLNGGSRFRFPAAYVAEVAFHPSAEPRQGWADPAKRRTNGRPVISRGFAGGSSRCRDIALNSNDISRIFAEVGTNTATRQREKRNFIAPTNPLERRLCELWQDLLHVEPVGIRDDFFDLGGHSLLAVRLFAEIQKITGRKLPLVTLFQAPTIEHLAAILSRSESADSLLVPIQAHGDKPPLFLVHGAGGDVLWGYANLALHLPQDQPVYGIKSSTQGATEAHLQLEEMARDYLQAVRCRQPEGPYFLGGYCFGGNVAYEMARQLRLQGQSVELVVLIDTAPANVGYEKLTWWRPGFAWRFARNFRFWLADFRALRAEDRRNFALRKLRWIGRKLRHRIGLGSDKDRFDLEEVIDPRQFPEYELALWQLHLEALVAHVERPYAGRVALLRTRGQSLFCSLEEDFCWGKLVKGGVLVKEIPGSHENIFMGHNVQILASELTKLLVKKEDLRADAARAASSAKLTEPASQL
jgi:amino acid adenylation domain-containing protein/FkbH-like protein